MNVYLNEESSKVRGRVTIGRIFLYNLFHVSGHLDQFEGFLFFDSKLIILVKLLAPPPPMENSIDFINISI